MNSKLSHITRGELIKDYFESYVDIARLEVALRLPDATDEMQERLDTNFIIVGMIAEELAARGDDSIFGRRTLVLGPFSMEES